MEPDKKAQKKQALFSMCWVLVMVVCKYLCLNFCSYDFDEGYSAVICRDCEEFLLLMEASVNIIVTTYQY